MQPAPLKIKEMEPLGDNILRYFYFYKLQQTSQSTTHLSFIDQKKNQRTIDLSGKRSMNKEKLYIFFVNEIGNYLEKKLTVTILDGINNFRFFFFPHSFNFTGNRRKCLK